MSKSRNNAIALAATADETARLLRQAKTDSDPHITYDPRDRPEVPTSSCSPRCARRSTIASSRGRSGAEEPPGTSAARARPSTNRYRKGGALLALRSPVGLRLRLHNGKAGVVVRMLVQVCSGDLRGHGHVVIGDVGLEIMGAVLELDVHPHSELLEIKPGYRPVNSDPLASSTRLTSREVGPPAHPRDHRAVRADALRAQSRA